MALLRAAEWLPLCDVGPLRRCTKTLSQQLLQLSDDLSEGRIFSCFMHAWVSLGHYPLAREPTVLRVACQYVLSLRLPCGLSGWPCMLALTYGRAS